MISIKNISCALLLILMTISIGNAQTNLNNYKYVIVESQFHFQNEKNEYDLNRLVRFLFRKHGFRVIMEGEALPEDLRSDYCLALNSEVTARGALRTKALIVLRNCDNEIVFTSEEGITKEKSFDRAYDLAIRNAFESFETLEYEYNPAEKSNSDQKEEKVSEQAEEAQNEIKELKEEIKELKEKNVVVKEQSELVKSESVVPETKVAIEEPEVVAEAVIEKKASEPTPVKAQYTAVPIENGFELTDKNDQVKYTIFKTGMENIFTIKDLKGIIYKKGDAWVREYVEGEKTIYESLFINF